MSQARLAFLSLHQTAGLLDLAQVIASCGYDLLCDQETASFLGRGGLEVAQVEVDDARNCELVICDLYDFQSLMNQEGGLTEEEARTKMDLEHQAIILAAASNYQQTAIVCHGSDYRRLKEHLRHLGETTITLRKALAAKAFQKVAEHNFAISAWFNLNGANIGQQQTLSL